MQTYCKIGREIIKYIPLQQGLRHSASGWSDTERIIKYIPLQQGLRPCTLTLLVYLYYIIKYIPLQQGLRLPSK